MKVKNATLYIVICILYGSPTFLLSQEISSFIHVDQFGYLTNSTKVAVISNPQIGYNAQKSYSPGTFLELRNASNNEMEFRSQIVSWNGGNTHSQSGDSGWWFDFSEVTDEGSYYVFDPNTNHRSAIFNINSNPYLEVLKAATNMFYYNRCNAPKEEAYAGANWVDTDNFTQDISVRSALDQDNPDTERDLRGGWFDAGDYNKYVTFTHGTLHQLLTSYETNPDVFTDDWNIPESGNGVPDILDEIKWEFDWLYKMINADGSVILKMGSLDYDINDLSPPSINSAPRYYTPTCSSASLVASSVCAHAAKVYRNIPGLADFADVLESDAVLCWNKFLEFYENNDLETDCDDQTVKAGDADWTEQDQIDNAVVAAIYLFDITGRREYSDFVRDNLSRTEPFTNNFFSARHITFLEAVLLYTTLLNTDQNTRNRILQQCQNAVNWPNFSNNNEDLYRVGLPDWNYYWGSNMTTADHANLSLTFRKYNISNELNEALWNKASDMLHYFHGVNPQELVNLSNMYDYGAEKSVNEIAHSWFIEGTDWDNAITSRFGPAPGFLSGGPNQAYTGNLTPPANQPILKSYLDYNDWFTEPAIYYQATYIQLLTNFVNTSVVSSNPTYHSESNIIITPNPSDGQFLITGKLTNYTVDVLNVNGDVLLSKVIMTPNEELNLMNAPSGMYILKFSDNSSSHVSFQKVIKL